MMAEQQVDGPPNKKQKVGTPSTPTDNEDTFLDELPEELFTTRNGETDDNNSKTQELQQLLESETPSSNLSSNKIHHTANPAALTGKDLSNPSSPTINNSNSVKSPALNAMVSSQITTSSIASPVPSAPSLSAAVGMNSQLHSSSGTLNPTVTPNSLAMTTISSPLSNLSQNYHGVYNSGSPQGLNSAMMSRIRNGPTGNQGNASLHKASNFGRQMGDQAIHMNTAMGNNTLATVKPEPNFMMGQAGLSMNQGMSLGEMMTPIQNQQHLNPSLQQQSSHLTQSADTLDNHLGSYSNLANIGPSTSLAGLDMTTRFDSIIPKTKQGITTVAGDFDLCVPCFNEKGHDHKMEKLGFDLDVVAVAVPKAIVEQAARPAIPSPAIPSPASRPNMPAVSVNPFSTTPPAMNEPINGNPLRPNTSMSVTAAQPNVPMMPGTPSPMRNWYNGNNNPVQQPLTQQQPQGMYGSTNSIVSQPRPPMPVRQSRPTGQLQEQMARILSALRNNQGQQTAECIQMMRENPQLMAVFLRMRQAQQHQAQQAQQAQVQQQQAQTTTDDAA